MMLTTKRVIILSLLISVAACKPGDSRQEVSFKLTRPLGQHSAYAMKYNIKEEDIWADPADNSVNEEVWDALLDTEVTENRPDGGWTLLTRFTKVDVKSDGESDEETNRAWTGISFSITKDKDGRVLDVPETSDALNNDFKPRMILMDPTMMLPTGQVKVGASWPIDVTHTIQKGDAPVIQTLRGTGTLKEVNAGRATIEFLFTSEISMTSPEADEEADTWVGDCRATAVFDLGTARFTSNNIDMNIETPGEAWGDNPDLIKIIITSSMRFDILGQ